MPPPQESGRIRTPLVLIFVVGLFLIVVPGCHDRMKEWLVGGPGTPVACVLPADATKDEIIQHLNNNTEKLTAWQSTNVTISTTTPVGLPIRLSAYLAVESPRNFRLKAKSLMGDEADFGSNSERFWFWMRRSKPKHVYTVRHDDFEAIRGRFPLPFRPDWLMEALGVIPLDPAQFTMQHRVDGSPVVSLVSNQTTPDGRAVRRVVLVDSCLGRIVKQTLYDSAGVTIASAEFNDYRFDPATGVLLAHQISLDWPKTRTSMTLKIHDAQINPGPQPPIMWTLPKFDNYAQLDLARHFGRTVHSRPLVRTPRRYAAVGAKTVPTVDDVGRVRISSDSPDRFQPPVESERPDFVDEQPAPANERPQFADERPAPSATTPRFSKPLVRPVEHNESANGQAKPFPGE